MEYQKINLETIHNFITTLRAFYKRVELLNFKYSEEFENELIKLFEPIKVYNIVCEGIFPTIERITINKKVTKGEINTRIYEVDKLKYPPAGCVKRYGRANLKRQSVFYGTFNFMTAVMEMKPEKGDLITVSRWKLKRENNSMVVCPMFLKQPNDGSTNIKLNNLYNWFICELQKFPPLLSKAYYELHQFYSDCFSREIDTQDNQGYIITALIANKILNYYKNGIVDAIVYPSTKDDLRTENIAIKKDSFDENYQLSETIEKRLLDFSPAGDRFVFERLGESLIIDGNKIIWR